jgi:putative flippase GtrA
VARGPRRELISRSYNLILRTAFATGFHDAQCGFKAVRAEAARALLPEVQDDGWFFDTELLLLAEHHGLRIHEVPVDWVDDPDSRVDVRRTAIEDLKGVARMARRFLSDTPELDYRRAHVVDDMGRAGVSFATIGVLSTLVSLGTFLALRGPIGALGANAVALTLTAGVNAWANRRFTLGRRGAGGRRRHYRLAASLYLGTLVVSSVALIALQAIGAAAALEAASLVLIWAVVGVLRFRRLLDGPPTHARAARPSTSRPTDHPPVPNGHTHP